MGFMLSCSEAIGTEITLWLRRTGVISDYYVILRMDLQDVVP